MPFRRYWLRRRPSAGTVFYWAYKDAQREARRGRRPAAVDPNAGSQAVLVIVAGLGSLIPGFLLKTYVVGSWAWPVIGWTCLIGGALLIGTLLACKDPDSPSRGSAITFTVGAAVFEVGLTLFSAEAAYVGLIPVIGVIIMIFIMAAVGMLQVGMFYLLREAIPRLRRP